MREITYEDIKNANATIKTTPIKGKNYADVSERIRAFRMVYPTGRIITQLVSLENGVCIMRTEVSTEDGNILGTGTAYEKENSTFINKTSYIENCETSAVGRALGMAGFGSEKSVSSAEEVLNAMNNQKDTKEEKKFIACTDIQVARLTALGADIEKMLKFYKVESVKQISQEEMEKVLVKKMAEKNIQNPEDIKV